jgi:phosphatidate cytidylyltransferase
MLLKRLATAAVLLPLLVLYIMKLPPVYFALLVALASAAAQSELYGMYGVGRPLKYLGMALGALLVACLYMDADVAGALALSVMLVSAVRLFAKRDPSGSLREAGAAVFGLLYIPLLFGFQLGLRAEAPGWVIFLYGSVWAADSLAYAFGNVIGGRKLYASISPKKTVSGAVGSVLGGSAGALVIWGLSLPFGPMPLVPEWAAGAGAVVGAVTVVGDLVESMLKRDAGVKDSGSIFPGHGGLLDKIDGALFAGPVLYALMRATGAY